MSDPEPIDLSQLQNLNLAPDWVGDLQKREAVPGEVVWGRAPENEREARGGGQGQGYAGGGGRGPRRDGGGFGARGDFNRPGGPPRGPRPDGGGPRGPRQDDRGPRPAGGPGGFRSEGPRGPRPDGPPRGDGPRGPRPGGPPGADRGPRPGGPRDDRRGGPDRREGGRPDFRHDRGRGHGRFDDRPHIEPLPGWRARLFAEPRSLEAITRQVKASGRAYPVFELGRLFLAGRDRYVVEFSRLPQTQGPRNTPKGTPVPPAEPVPGPEQIYHIPLDGSLWLNRDEAIRHLINGPALKKFYRKETLSVEPPKGTFTSVAVCGFSGEILGPPNHHSFQTTVARLHREQFYNLPIERYKARIRTEKDEALVAKWLEQQSTTTVYIPLTAEEAAALEAAEAAAKAAKAAEESSQKPADQPEGTGGPAEESAAGVEGPETTETPAPAAEAAADDATQAETEAEASPAAPETAAPAEAESNTAPEEGTGVAAEAGSSGTGSATESAEETSSEADDAGAAPSASDAPKAEPLKNWAAVEAHFLAHHADKAVKAVSRIKVPGNIAGRLLAPSLLALLRHEVEQQQRFPMQLVQDLCRDLEKENLKFFKRDKKATFVCRTRPHFIEDETHLSPRLRSIVGVVRANPGITVGKLVSVLAPHVEKPEVPAAAEQVPAAAAAAPVEAAAAAAEAPAAPVAEAAAEETPVPAAEAPDTAAPALAETADAPESAAPETPAADTPAGEEPAAETAASPDTEAPAPQGREPRERGSKKQRHKKTAPAPEAPPAPLTAEEIGVLQDLRWLVQEGFVTEFASSELQLLGRPPQPPAAPAGKKARTGEEPASTPPAEHAVPASEETATSPDSPDAENASTSSPEPETPAAAHPADKRNEADTPIASGDQPLL